MRIACLLAVAVSLSACATAPKMLWLRTDGQSAAANPVLAQQFQVERTICVGEMQKANVSGVTFTGGGLSGAIAAQNRADAVDAVLRGCMAEKGYVLVPEEQADAQREQMAAVAATKKAQEDAQAKLAAKKPPSGR